MTPVSNAMLTTAEPALHDFGNCELNCEYNDETIKSTAQVRSQHGGMNRNRK